MYQFDLLNILSPMTSFAIYITIYIAIYIAILHYILLHIYNVEIVKLQV